MPERRLVAREIRRVARRVYGRGDHARVLAEELLQVFQGKGWEVLGYEDAAQFDETARFNLLETVDDSNSFKEVNSPAKEQQAFLLETLCKNTVQDGR